MTSLHGDPYRILGLLPGATETQVKSAYRRLVKKYHPDAAGDATIGRFLAVQAAYDALMDPASGHLRTRPRTTARWAPWDADPERTRATRRAPGRDGTTAGAGQGARRSSPGSAWDWARPGASGSTETAGPAAEPAGSSTSSGSGPAGRAGQASASGGDERARGGGKRRQRDHHVPKARPGSTTYDGADRDAEPDWDGATWYGQAMGTYWTINPKEYADPRKHGPEYQARAWRAVAGLRGRSAPEMPPAREEPTPVQSPASARGASRGGLLSRILGGRAGHTRGDAE